jgi:hypothetical protein
MRKRRTFVLAITLAAIGSLAGCNSSAAKPSATTAALSPTTAPALASPSAAHAAGSAVASPPTAPLANVAGAANATATPVASTAQACNPAEATRADAALQPFVAEVDGDVSAAANAARDGLAGPIGQLQATRQRLDSLGLPACATTAVQAFDNYLDARITEFLDFQKAAPVAQVSNDDQTAVGLQQPVVRELAALHSASVGALATVTPAP